MAIKQGAVKKDHSNLNRIMIAISIYIAIIIAATALCTTLIYKEILGEKKIQLYTMVILFAASTLATWSNQERNLLTGVVKGTAYIAVTLLISALLFGVQFQGIKEGVFVILLGSIFSSLTGVKRKRKTLKHRSKK